MKVWQRFMAALLAPAPADRLGKSRALWFGGLFVLYAVYAPLSRHADVIWRADWGDVAAVFYQPLWTLRWLGIPAPAHPWIDMVVVAWLATLALSAIGLWSRASMAACAVLGMYLWQLPHNFGHVTHTDAAPALISAVLACSRAGDAWSLDAWRRRDQGAPAASGEYTWPLWAIWGVLGWVFFAAGVSKLRHGGFGHFTGDSLVVQLVVTQRYFPGTRRAAAEWLIAHPTVATLGYAAVIGGELAYALALFNRRLRPYCGLLGVAMFVVFDRFLALRFLQLLWAQLFLFPWDELGRLRRARLPGK